MLWIKFLITILCLKLNFEISESWLSLSPVKILGDFFNFHDILNVKPKVTGQRCYYSGQIIPSSDLLSFTECEKIGRRFKYTTFYCDEDEIFNSTIQGCYPLLGGGKPIWSLPNTNCFGNIEPTKYPHLLLWKHYMLCKNNRVIVGVCKEGFYFDQFAKKCSEKEKRTKIIKDDCNGTASNFICTKPGLFPVKLYINKSSDAILDKNSFNYDYMKNNDACSKCFYECNKNKDQNYELSIICIKKPPVVHPQKNHTIQSTVVEHTTKSAVIDEGLFPGIFNQISNFVDTIISIIDSLFDDESTTETSEQTDTTEYPTSTIAEKLNLSSTTTEVCETSPETTVLTNDSVTITTTEAQNTETSLFTSKSTKDFVSITTTETQNTETSPSTSKYTNDVHSNHETTTNMFVFEKYTQTTTSLPDIEETKTTISSKQETITNRILSNSNDNENNAVSTTRYDTTTLFQNMTSRKNEETSISNTTTTSKTITTDLQSKPTFTNSSCSFQSLKGHTCTSEGFFRYRNSCNLHYHCSYNQDCNKLMQSELYVCPQCLKFNVKKGRCDWPEEVSECTYDNKKKRFCSSSGKYPIPGECNKYYQCNKNKPLMVKKCPSGHRFEENFSKCVKGKKCKNNSQSCNENEWIFDKYDCRKYSVCLKNKNNWKLKKLRCPGGQIFNGAYCQQKEKSYLSNWNELSKMYNKKI